jgi:hypothetical protein
MLIVIPTSMICLYMFLQLKGVLLLIVIGGVGIQELFIIGIITYKILTAPKPAKLDYIEKSLDLCDKNNKLQVKSNESPKEEVLKDVTEHNLTDFKSVEMND